MAGSDLLSVAGGSPPGHIKMFALASDPPKPDTGETLLTGGTRTCPLQGRFPGPVLDATVSSSLRRVGGRCGADDQEQSGDGPGGAGNDQAGTSRIECEAGFGTGAGSNGAITRR